MKVRLDKLLLARALATSRERAQALILAGRVLVNEQKVEKAGMNVESEAAIRVLGDDMPFVSRGGLKLARALEQWHVKVQGETCVDVGASTGGFTDCLLQNGAAQVIAVDTGYGQMDLKIRNDPRVRLLEKTNARSLTVEHLCPDGNGPDSIGLVVMDVSFISATLVLPAVLGAVGACTKQDFELIVLVKPQFEVGRGQVGKGGIVRDAAAQQSAVDKVAAAARQYGGAEIDITESPILGAEGNREFLLYARFRQSAPHSSESATRNEPPPPNPK